MEKAAWCPAVVCLLCQPVLFLSSLLLPESLLDWFLQTITFEVEAFHFQQTCTKGAFQPKGNIPSTGKLCPFWWETFQTWPLLVWCLYCVLVKRLDPSSTKIAAGLKVITVHWETPRSSCVGCGVTFWAIHHGFCYQLYQHRALIVVLLKIRVSIHSLC